MRTACLLLVATLLLVSAACDGGDDGEATATPATPAATTTATETAATPTSTPTASPAPTSSPAATTTSTASASLCPIAASACSFANQMAKHVLEGNGEAVMSSARTTFYQCPGPNGGPGDPFPLCDGAAAGETRAGFPIRRIQSEGGAMSEADASRLVSEWGGRTEPSLSDDYGTGEAQAYTIACPDVGLDEGKDCEEHFSLIFSGLSPASDATQPGLRTMLVLDVALGGESEPRVTGFATGVLTFGLDLALGGGTGAYADPEVPTVLAPPVEGASSVTFFPWDPSALIQ